MLAQCGQVLLSSVGEGDEGVSAVMSELHGGARGALRVGRRLSAPRNGMAVLTQRSQIISTPLLPSPFVSPSIPSSNPPQPHCLHSLAPPTPVPSLATPDLSSPSTSPSFPWQFV